MLQIVGLKVELVRRNKVKKITLITLFLSIMSVSNDVLAVLLEHKVTNASDVDITVSMDFHGDVHRPAVKGGKLTTKCILCCPKKA